MSEPGPRTRLPIAVRAGNWLFHWRNYVFPSTFLALLFAGRPRYPAGSAEADVLLDALGVGLALAGQAVRVAVIGLVYIQRGGRGGRVHADSLVQEGIFAHSRNPLYLGNLLVFGGLITVLNSWPGWLVGLPAVVASYYAIVRAEEHFLLGRFGPEYADYCARVHRFWPSLPGLRDTLRAHRFDWRRVIRKEYGSTFAWTTAVLGLLAWERIANGEAEAVRADLPAYGAAWAVIVALYVVARVLKKTRRLRLS